MTLQIVSVTVDVDFVKQRVVILEIEQAQAGVDLIINETGKDEVLLDACNRILAALGHYPIVSSRGNTLESSNEQ